MIETSFRATDSKFFEFWFVGRFESKQITNVSDKAIEPKCWVSWFSVSDDLYFGNSWQCSRTTQEQGEIVHVTAKRGFVTTLNDMVRSDE